MVDWMKGKASGTMGKQTEIKPSHQTAIAFYSEYCVLRCESKRISQIHSRCHRRTKHLLILGFCLMGMPLLTDFNYRLKSFDRFRKGT